MNPNPNPSSNPKPNPNVIRKEKEKEKKKTAWTDLEAKILAEHFVYVFRHPSVGNDQSHTSFWGEVRRQYNSIVPVKRRPDQISGKWSKMQRDVKIWIGIYNKYERMWESGCNNDDIMSAARMAFKAQTKGRHFAFEDAWRVLRNCPKFLEGESISSSNK
ncbi:glutathione S-transferase T3-like [Rutidosis leptorrhynchoides]|uniref:glutathione S-transferase T3-like n=1 Tax=Rutidosis leptorrhynchoides TaxID=125765 RepID=UPI003A99392D